MDSSPVIDFTRVWSRARDAFRLGPESLHGPRHWRRVETTRLWLAKQHGADADVVRLFALLHDVERWDEGSDPEHGRRGAVLAGRLRGEAFLLDDARFALLEYAIAFHADGKRSDDLTLGACWDADRLDLPRVGIWPNPDLLCTGAAKELLGRMESARPGARPRRKL